MMNGDFEAISHKINIQLSFNSETAIFCQDNFREYINITKEIPKKFHFLLNEFIQKQKLLIEINDSLSHLLKVPLYPIVIGRKQSSIQNNTYLVPNSYQNIESSFFWVICCFFINFVYS